MDAVYLAYVHFGPSLSESRYERMRKLGIRTFYRAGTFVRSHFLSRAQQGRDEAVCAPHDADVDFGKNVEARQQGLPLFITKNEMPFIHEGHEQDYTVWRVDKRVHGHASKAIYTLQHNATKMYAQVYHEAFNITLMIAEKIATPVGLESVGGHEWTSPRAFGQQKDSMVWCVH
ncbi:hypothetical protein D9756_008562 [Leucocoprinus leucothites]|uniref:Uncharacterized protein n=1 Tax=Leucocoprinus leucothites TaxID=201217 RepID=A0A8H5D0X0_9AGAR|nr:hypothetical protein D9756_008562 [Leucoagaricus leucothites]